jgi:hypothetical protein
LDNPGEAATGIARAIAGGLLKSGQEGVQETGIRMNWSGSITDGLLEDLTSEGTARHPLNRRDGARGKCCSDSSRNRVQIRRTPPDSIQMILLWRRSVKRLHLGVADVVRFGARTFLILIVINEAAWLSGSAGCDIGALHQGR